MAAACALFGSNAFAYFDFVPTPFEIASWPTYCRVQYSTINDGLDYDAPKYSAGEVARWRDIIGTRTFDGLHHYCASIQYLRRAELEPDLQKQRFLLGRAWDDGMYSFTRADPQSSVYPNMVATIARIRAQMGHEDEAIDILEKGIKVQPTRPEAYIQLALIQRKHHKLKEALATLESADAATRGGSADVQYDLGLINLEIGDIDAAVQNARRAYGLGYPLPGLKWKLQKMKRWDSSVAATTR